HLLFKKEKITKELLDNEINPDWLDEHACLLNMRDIAATRTVPILDTEKQEGDNIIYVIKAGDTLSKIANRHGITLGKLIELNPKYKENPNTINVGEKITIETKQEATPQLEFHVCQIDPETNQRETWSQIAAKYSLAPKELLELNKHYNSDPTALAIGDKLNVKTKSQDITTPEKRNTLPAEDVTTDKTVYAFSNAQCTASDKTHFNVLPIIDLGQADKNTPVIKTNKVVLKSKLLSNSDALELLAKDKGILIKKGSK
uniref:LysM peptidoglycan-binding domain-containing protein n=1 Tax=uncultured Photobacterium sp. TaxID=173973 RepID=UPI002621259E